MTAGALVELGPDQVAAYVDGMAAAFVSVKRPALPEVLEELRALVAGREVLSRSTYSDQCVALLLDHVEQLHATIRQLAELSTLDGERFALNQYVISRAVHRQLATFSPPKS